MFSKVLIANRGAIAVRIIRTLKSLGVSSVAVYSEADADSLHVRLADEAHSLGEGAASSTYLNQERIFEIAHRAGVEAIHPGYGFVSENPAFARRCENEGLVFLGPSAVHMEAFGLKHTARELAATNAVPLLPGSELLDSLESARLKAAEITYPVMLKSTAGGGGIGMQLCYSETELEEAFASVKRLSENNFANDGVFIEKFVERARHIEVQVFADGQGQALALGERDCSSQRRNQKVIEETPAPNLSEAVRRQMHEVAVRLLASVSYRSAGTVEFVYDQASEEFYFLEVNTRLQVEHGVSEEVFGVDLVAWMVALGAGELPPLETLSAGLSPSGHAIQVRVYAEDPYKQFQPSAGLLSDVYFPDAVAGRLRIDSWIDAGQEVSAFFDPMLAKVIGIGADREQALQNLDAALARTRIYGVETNVDYVRSILREELFLQGAMYTRYLNDYPYQPARIDVLRPGTQTSVQDYPGRSGYWDIGVPPSGPFDPLSFRLANRMLGNDEAAAGLEITLSGPLLQFSVDTDVIVCGADFDLRIDDQPAPMWRVLRIRAGQRVDIAKASADGARCYLAIAGGLQCPQYMGSRATFTLGQFGGHVGRALRVGDVLHLATSPRAADIGSVVGEELRPAIGRNWELRVIYGPHGAPDFFTHEDIDTFFSHHWEVHYNSSRTGIRLIGPKPHWARSDGGEAGMHPSNIHDNAYAIGTVDFTGDMPVILGPDGPSLGGFVCPATVIHADLWKLGQLKAGDSIRFVPCSWDDAVACEAAQLRSLERLEPEPDIWPEQPLQAQHQSHSPVLERIHTSDGLDVCLRLSGDHYLLVELGELILDINLRFRAHALMLWLQQHRLPGMLELTPGIRSLQIHYDSQQLGIKDLQQLVSDGIAAIGDCQGLEVPSRTVYLPLSWDDQACHEAVEKYMQSVRADAPWCPSNLEFIRRINGLASLQDVKDIVFSAAYLVMGLGDVYLGAPVATPLDPRHRLVTTKYNPARTWTAENSVGIGGSYLCVYGMEGPGGYQFVGRTLQMWNRYRQTVAFSKPWLLRFFDQIRFYEVSHEELQRIRRDFPKGDYPLRISEGSFKLSDYNAFLASEQQSIRAFTERREAAFAEELQRWVDSGQINYAFESSSHSEGDDSLEPGCVAEESHIAGNVWKILVEVGDRIEVGQPLAIIESMKMEIEVAATVNGTVVEIRKPAGKQVLAGQALLVVRES